MLADAHRIELLPGRLRWDRRYSRLNRDKSSTSGVKLPKVLRADFAAASIGFVLPAQRENLAKLHDWLIVEVGISADEVVVASSNYQQGRFGRMPSHVVLLTTHRLAFTHDGGLRAAPLSEVDSTRIGLRLGVASGDLSVALLDGTTLDFRRGMTAGIHELATALQTTPLQPGTTAPASPGEAIDLQATWHGNGSGELHFDEIGRAHV